MQCTRIMNNFLHNFHRNYHRPLKYSKFIYRNHVGVFHTILLALDNRYLKIVCFEVGRLCKYCFKRYVFKRKASSPTMKLPLGNKSVSSFSYIKRVSKNISI